MAHENFDPTYFPMAESQAAFMKQYVPADDDEGVTANFFVKEEIMPFLSQQQGREVKEKKNYVRIVVKGNSKNIVIRQVTEQDKKRFPYSWQQFSKGESQSKGGTALYEIFDADSELVPHYYASNVFTVEDLAEVNDSNLQSLGAGARENRMKAREYLEKLRRSNPEDAQKIAQQQAQIDQLREELNALKVRRGRPPKSESDE